jgi:3-hydroxybutyryl-CoA dehydratase
LGFYRDMGSLEQAIGQVIRIRRTVSEADVLGFAEISGDRSPNHVDAAFMRKTPYGARIAHGALLVAYLSQCSTAMAEKLAHLVPGHFPVSLGYDRIRFLRAVTIGTEIELVYTIAAVDAVKLRAEATCNVFAGPEALVATGTHIMKWIAKT